MFLAEVKCVFEYITTHVKNVRHMRSTTIKLIHAHHISVWNYKIYNP